MPSPLAASRTLATLGGQTMGTTWSARLAIPSHLDLHRLHALLQGELDRVVAQMSTWEASSALCHYNRAAAGSWQVLPEDFARVMAAALRIARDSEGAFDPTVGALVHAWGFGAGGGTPALPPEQTLQQARARPRWSQLALCGQPLALLQPGEVQLDLSAIAKGYAVDLLLQALGRRGIDDALVEVGGELAGRGRKPDGTPWRVLVEPGPTNRPPCRRACWRSMAWRWRPPVIAGTGSNTTACATAIPWIRVRAGRCRRRRRSRWSCTARWRPMPGPPR